MAGALKSHFRGWLIPGPIPPGAAGHGPEPEVGETLDAISGHYRLFQLANGHRFSTDDLLVAWYGSSWSPRAERILDLGSGIGTVATIVAWRLPHARLVTVEAQEESLRLARKSVVWNGLADRVDMRAGDFRNEGLRSDERFDLILGSPPYFPPGTGVEGDHPQKIACRFELRGSIADYCTAAARHLQPGGIFSTVFPVNPAAQHQRVVAAAGEAGLAIVRWRPVILREADSPLLGVFVMMRREDLPAWMHEQTWVEPPLIIRTTDGKIHPEYSALKLSIGFPP